MVNLNEIVRVCREKGCEKFERYAEFTNTDEGKKMITFISKTLNIRNVNNWGREEDTDIHIGLDENGWIMYKQINENGAGDFKIIEEAISAMNDEMVIDYLNSDKCTNSDYLQFMSSAYTIY